MPSPHPTVFPRLRLGLLGLLALLAAAAACAQSPGAPPLFTLRIWRQQDGLPSNEITALCLDRRGYLWIGTSAGLARFDGTRFLAYHYTPAEKGNTTGFASIAAEPGGDGLWVAPHGGGLLRFRDGKFEPQTLPGNYASQRIARLFVAPDRALWIAFEGGEVMRLHGHHHEIFGASHGQGPNRSSFIASDGAGRVWLANASRLSRYEAGTLHPFPLDGVNDNLRLASSRKDGPWVLARGWLRKIVEDRVGFKIEINSGFNARSVQALLEDAGGAVWTGTRSRGLRRLSLPGEKSDLVLENPEDIGVLLEDGDGNIWVGSNGDGLIRVRSSMVRRFDKAQGLLESHTLGICEDNAGTIWIANRDGGVAYITEQGRVRTLDAPKGRDTFSARSVAPHGADGVIVTTSFGLLRATKQGLLPFNDPASPPQPPPHGEMRLTHRAANGDLWVILQPDLLGRLRAGAWQTFQTEGVRSPHGVQVIAEDAQGRIWAGAENSTLHRFEDGRFVPVPVAGGVAVQSLHFDAAGRGWIGTAGAGLMRLGDSAARSLDERHGLPASNITQILSDERGNLWLGSPKGIFQVRHEALEQFFSGKISHVDAVVLGADEGLIEATGANSHHPSAWKSRDGTLWFATRQGVVAVDPRRERVAATPPLVQVDTVRIGDLSLPANAPVRVPALSQSVELDYSVLCLSNPDRVRARVRLEGYEDEWTPAEVRRLARYTRLPPGEYRFVIEAHLAGAPGTLARTSVPVVVLAAWWQTLWFRFGAATLVLSLGVFAVRAWSHRRLRARLATLESESALERERTRIARNLHDDLGAGLTRISLLTQSARQHNDRVQLDKIYSTVSELTQSMDAIVWAVNPQHDDLESVANYIIAYAQGFLSDADIRARVSLPDFLPGHTLTAQHRHHLFLSCKEALHNIVKHARATEVSLRLGVAAGVLTIVIADNGRGFPPPGAERPGRNGLANLRTRLADLGGTCEIHSTPAGTTLTLTAPLPSHTTL